MQSDVPVSEPEVADAEMQSEVPVEEPPALDAEAQSEVPAAPPSARRMPGEGRKLPSLSDTIKDIVASGGKLPSYSEDRASAREGAARVATLRNMQDEPLVHYVAAGVDLDDPRTTAAASEVLGKVAAAFQGNPLAPEEMWMLADELEKLSPTLEGRELARRLRGE